jgi:hypothetical protein
VKPVGAAVEKARNLNEDPAELCKTIGPFTMMARDGTKMELLPAEDTIMMLSENVALGHVRVFHLAREHPAKLQPDWMGGSIGHWDRYTLVVDTIGFNTIRCFKVVGAPHNEAHHLVERYRLIDAGKILALKVAAEDPTVLTKPYTYTRYYQRSSTEIVEEFCEESQ